MPENTIVATRELKKELQKGLKKEVKEEKQVQKWLVREFADLRIIKGLLEKQSA